MLQIRILSITHKTPSWIQAGFEDYQKRLKPWCKLTLVEIPAEKRSTSSSMAKIIQREGEKLIANIKSEWVIALNINGELWSTEALAQKLSAWQIHHSQIDCLIGGPDGLSQNCLKKASVQWSLSPLTFPHFFVKLILAEQFYRALSLLEHHPYHR